MTKVYNAAEGKLEEKHTQKVTQLIFPSSSRTFPVYVLDAQY